MFVRTRGLILFALSLMILLVALGGGSIYADIREEQLHIRACDELVATLTPVGCIHEFVRGYTEEDDILLTALHADKAAEYSFDYSQDVAYPTAVVWPLRENEDAASLESGRVIYQAVLEFTCEDGSSEEREYGFEFAKTTDGRWQIVNRGF